jgi:hypothetical protein
MHFFFNMGVPEGGLETAAGRGYGRSVLLADSPLDLS